MVGAGSGALFRIAERGEMELVARLPQADLSRLTVGVPVTVTPVGSAQTYPGSIWQISPIIDAVSRQGVARIRIPYNRELRPGGFASAQIRAGSMWRPCCRNRPCSTTIRAAMSISSAPNDSVVRARSGSAR